MGVGYPRSPRAHIKYSRNREKDKYLEEGPILLTGPETLVRLGIRIRSSGNYSEWLSGAAETRRKVKQCFTVTETGGSHCAFRERLRCRALCQANEIR